jgi:hypothetical protein
MELFATDLQRPAFLLEAEAALTIESDVLKSHLEDLQSAAE